MSRIVHRTIAVSDMRSLAMRSAILLESSFANGKMGCHEMFVLTIFD